VFSSVSGTEEDPEPIWGGATRGFDIVRLPLSLIVDFSTWDLKLKGRRYGQGKGIYFRDDESEKDNSWGKPPLSEAESCLFSRTFFPGRSPQVRVVYALYNFS